MKSTFEAIEQLHCRAGRVAGELGCSMQIALRLIRYERQIRLLAKACSQLMAGDGDKVSKDVHDEVVLLSTECDAR